MNKCSTGPDTGRKDVLNARYTFSGHDSDLSAGRISISTLGPDILLG